MQILVVSSQDHARRAEVEDFIADVYRQHYGACVPTFPQTLIALLGQSGECVCASGLRFAETGFFSECYLDQPIETLLTRATGRAVRRSSIFEVSGLASRAPRNSAQFLRYIVSYGKRAEFDWAFFTATSRLRCLLGVLGLPVLMLGEAEKQRANNPRVWGSYYDRRPQVCAISRATAQGFLNSKPASLGHV